MRTQFDITILTNTPVDRLHTGIPADVLTRFGLTPGDFHSLPPETITHLRRHIGDGTLHPGGASANTGWALAKLGHQVAVVGYVGADEGGQLFHRSMTDAGATMPEPHPDARTMEINVLVEPHGQRTFATNGANFALTPELIPEAWVKHTRMLWLDAYLADKDYQHAAIRHAVAMARQHRVDIGLALSSPKVVERQYPLLCEIIRGGVTLLACNDSEMAALEAHIGQLESVHAAITRQALADTSQLVTHGAKGAEFVPAYRSHLRIFEATPAVPQVVDTTGAGDAFLAGFLDRYLRDAPYRECLQHGHALAGMVVQQVGARLPDLSREHLQPEFSRASA